jgi:anaerobic sulfite reductase subunit A
MAYKINDAAFGSVIKELSKNHKIYAPCLFEGHGTFSGTDIIRYDEVQNAGQIVFDKKSTYSFKEVILPISETLFYFTDDEMKEPKPVFENAVIFLRNCDLCGLKRLDDIYRSGDKQDFYYERLRGNAKFIVMGCDSSFENCFCESMGANKITDYDAYIQYDGEGYIIDSRFNELTDILNSQSAEKTEFKPKDIHNNIRIELPENIPASILESRMWNEYDARCVACGRCNFVCPTCACFTMQDIFYEDNKNAGERRRVWASCHVDGYTDIAGGLCFRKTKAERMRFKVLHKISDHKKKYGQNMCVGCGRCDDICPEYISFSNCISKVLHECKEAPNG